jgi:diguanylate cyclase (GGDEF)-like protein/PAS domain S-box-containing protein
MPGLFRYHSIRSKLFGLVILNGSFALLLVGLFLFGYEKIETKESAKRALSSQAGIVADSSAAALAFNDDQAATETLTALRADQNIVQAAIYTGQGHLFAWYTRADQDRPPATLPPQGTYFANGYLANGYLSNGYLSNGYLWMSRPIRLSGQLSGTVILKASLKEADARLKRNMSILIVALLISLIVALLLSSWMQRSITRPLQDLSSVARIVSQGEDYSARAVRSGDDEIGFLVDSFNHMLSQIEAREQALRESEERYALAARGSNDGLWDWKLTTDEIYFSSRWNQMLGYSEAETWQRPEAWFHRIHPSDRGRVQAEVDAHREGRTCELVTEYRIRQRNGAYLWVQSRGIAVRDAQGKAIRMAGSQTDITKGKVADPLTGLPNRLYFLDRLEGALEAERRTGARPAVLFLDMDRFKLVNDSMGHASGDALLEEVAARLRQSLQPGPHSGIEEQSFVARLGGDEFGVLLNRVSRPGDATRVAERILKDLNRPFRIEGRQVFAGVSIGVALSTPGDTPEELLRNADTAMYHAKTSGKSRLAVFDDGMRRRAIERLETETELRRAIEGGEMLLQYQPQVSISTRRLTGFEALVRWRHPERGIVPPSEFITVAEETDLIVPLGGWVLREACRQMADWQAHMPLDPPLTMAVNLSFRQLIGGGFVDEVRSVLRDTGLFPGSLHLEVTESQVMKDPEESIEILRRLKELGVGLEIDDFGTGYSSLSYLSCLPFDTVKIDRSFISDLGVREESGELVRTILDLARSLNLDVVAEGVETELQLEKLRALGCSKAQGFYFSKAVPGEIAAQLFEEENLRRGFDILQGHQPDPREPRQIHLSPELSLTETI